MKYWLLKSEPNVWSLENQKKAGYLGSIVVPDLLECGHHVTVLDNFMFKQTSLNHCCYHPNFKIIKGDIRIQSTIEPLINNSDVIIPLAALVGAPICDFQSSYSMLQSSTHAHIHSNESCNL